MTLSKQLSFPEEEGEKQDVSGAFRGCKQIQLIQRHRVTRAPFKNTTLTEECRVNTWRSRDKIREQIEDLKSIDSALLMLKPPRQMDLNQLKSLMHAAGSGEDPQSDHFEEGEDGRKRGGDFEKKKKKKKRGVLLLRNDINVQKWFHMQSLNRRPRCRKIIPG
ncbi:hypothetical protein NQZ68_029234 [Dissostichus eleginoides]|nr:hypothetical protein NQZ68_029234 [Dissostichus eleginoides]